MTILGIVVAGLILYVLSVLRQSAINRDAFEREIAAERAAQAIMEIMQKGQEKK